MPVASLNGSTIYFEVRGEGKPLVFVHGGFGGLGTGDVPATPARVERFARRLKVITYDRRSSGRSGFPESAHSLELFAEDLRALLRHLDIDSAAFWGTSAGVPIATTFALLHPKMTSRLILTDGAPWFSHDEAMLARLRERIAVLETKGPAAAYEARRSGGTVGLNLFAADRPAQTPDELRGRDERRAQIQARLTAVPREERMRKYAAELRTYAAYVGFDVTDRFRELRMPVLIVYGTADSIFPDAGWDRLTASMPNVTYLPLEGAEHGSTGSDARALDAVLDFALQPGGD